MIVKNKNQVVNLLSKLTRKGEYSRIIIVATKLLQEKLRGISQNDILWLTPESFDYKLRFKTEEVLSYPEIWVIGTEIFKDSYRGSKLEFSLLRAYLYNPLIKVTTVNVINEDWLLEALFSNKLLTYNIDLLNHWHGTVFFVVSTRRDIITWYPNLKKNFKDVFLIGNHTPLRLTKDILTISRKNGIPLVTTKDIAFKFAEPSEKIVLLPQIYTSQFQEETFDYEDMCLLLAFEKRINNVQVITRILTKFYHCRKNEISRSLDELISKGIVHKFPSGIIVPTFLGKTIIRNFLSVITVKKVLKKLVKDQKMVSKDKIYGLLNELPEFYREQLLIKEVDNLNVPLGIINGILELEVVEKRIWILKGILSLLRALRRNHLTDIIHNVQEVIDELKENKEHLLNNTRRKIKRWLF